MESALAWIGQIASWVGQWIPRWVLIPSTEAAVKYESFFLPARLRQFKGDMRITACGPGLHWYWPATTMMEKYPTAFQSDNLPSQTFDTADGKTVTVGGVVSYTVTDIVKLLTSTHSAQKTIQVHTLAAIHDVCCKLSHEQLMLEQQKGTLKTKLRNGAQKPLTPFGVEINDCMLTDLTKSRAYRLIQSTQVDSE